MTYKFRTRNSQTGRTGAVTVKADRELAARQMLARYGYEVLSLAPAGGDAEGLAKVTGGGTAQLYVSSRPTLSRKGVLKVRFEAFLHDIFAPFFLFS